MEAQKSLWNIVNSLHTDKADRLRRLHWIQSPWKRQILHFNA